LMHVGAVTRFVMRTQACCHEEERNAAWPGSLHQGV
jgi:hypothetical protein